MNRLRALRKERGLTQEAVAFMLGTNQQQISKYENDIASLSERDIVELARYFGVTADYFLSLSDMRVEVVTDAVRQSDSDADVAEVQELLCYFLSMEGECRKIMIEIGKRLSSAGGVEK